MKKFLTIIILFLLSINKAMCVRNYDKASLEAMVFPIMYINTVNGEQPTCDYVTDPEYGGTSISNATKVPGRIVMTLHGDTIYDSKEYIEDKSGMTIKIHGNTSAGEYFKKKPFKIKLQKKADLLLRGNDSRYKDKNWLLLRDDFTLSTMIGLKVNELVGHTWTPGCQYVNVIFNGDFRGIYLLIEQVKRNPLCRLDVDESTGYIIEWDAYAWNEDKKFSSSMGFRYTFKYPDPEDITDEQIAEIKAMTDEMESHLWDRSYEPYIDCTSMARWLMGHDILGSNDPYGSNIYIMKYDNTPNSKFEMASMWDYDNIMQSSRTEWAPISNMWYYSILYHYDTSPFKTAYRNLYQERSAEIFSKVLEMLNDIEGTDFAKDLQVAVNNDRIIWGYTFKKSVNKAVSDARDWFEARKIWMDTQILGESTVLPSTHTKATSPLMYDLLGRQASEKSPIVIKGGKKYRTGKQ